MEVAEPAEQPMDVPTPERLHSYRVQDLSMGPQPEDPLNRSARVRLPAELLEDGPVTYEIVSGATRKGGNLLVDYGGFSYAKKRTSAQAIICSICQHTKCSATVRQVGDQFQCGPKKHNHAGETKQIVCSQARAFGMYR